MSFKLQSQAVTSIAIGPHSYDVLDIRVTIGGEEIPVLRDETGRLCVFSRLISVLAGYKQKDTLYRMVRRREHNGFKVGFTHRHESATEFHNLTTRLALSYPVLKGLFFRVRTDEILLYSQSFALLTTLSKLDLEPIFKPLIEAEEALQSKDVSEDEALVDELTSNLVETEESEIPGRVPQTVKEGGIAESRVAQETKTAIDGHADVPEGTYIPAWGVQNNQLQQLAPEVLRRFSAPPPVVPQGAADVKRSLLTGIFSDAIESELLQMVSELESAADDLTQAIDVPVEGGFLGKMTAPHKTPPRRQGRIDSPTPLPSGSDLMDLVLDEDIPSERGFVPPGYPEVFEDITGTWVGKVYAWVLAHAGDPHKRPLGANLPNIPLLIRSLLCQWGFLTESGKPVGDGRYFLFQEHTGSLKFNRHVVPRLICTFLATNPKIDYRGFLVDKPPVFEMREVRALAQKTVRGLLQRGG